MPERLKKGDMVLVLSGKDKGKKGKILEVMPEGGRVLVERVNVAKRHQRPTRNFPGGIIEKPLPLYASKLKLVCPRCGKPSRVGSKLVENRHVRVCRKCEEVIDKV